MKRMLTVAALCAVPLAACSLLRQGSVAHSQVARSGPAHTFNAPPAPRAFYGRRLEPQASLVLHGAGQSDGSSFAAYTHALQPHRPMLSMSYVDLKDDIPAFFARLRQELALYPDLVIPQIGLAMNAGDSARHYESSVASGSLDPQLAQLCVGLRSLERPAFLRVGYEFNGPWNGYQPSVYIAAFRHIASTIRGCGLDNVALVWNWSPDAELDRQRGGASPASAADRWLAFYPGDAWVDWWALNLFSEQSITSPTTQAFLQSAAEHRFPVMIAESTPKGHSVTEGQSLVDQWYAPYFALIRRSPQIKAFCYIDWDWRAYPQWASWGDARIEDNPTVLAFLRTLLADDLYANSRSSSATLDSLRAR